MVGWLVGWLEEHTESDWIGWLGGKVSWLGGTGGWLVGWLLGCLGWLGAWLGVGGLVSLIWFDWLVDWLVG